MTPDDRPPHGCGTRSASARPGRPDSPPPGRRALAPAPPGPRFGRAAPLAPLAAALALALAGPAACSGGGDEDYKARPSPSGRAANLPSVPTLPQKPKKQGDAYTVYGAIHDLRSRVHGPKLQGKTISVVGYITKTNLGDAPPCAVHPGGVKDKPECEKDPPPVPAFWIADDKEAPERESIKVLGFASNYARLYDAIRKYKGGSKESAKDDVWGVDIPNPVPNKGAKVKVTGVYNFTFTKASQGTESDPLNGVLTYESLTYLEPPPEPAKLPGM
ncbi:MAG TPA: hypothetical protein VFS43_15090 [Polyangiaceae bacterium]|nr:hypothetical protein [Polyangiaceae bacterium]